MNLNKVDVLDFLTALGIRNISDHGQEIQYSCPWPGHLNGDESPSAYMNSETTAWFCHGCKRKGNAIGFLAQLENISPLEASRHIRDRYDSGFINPNSFEAELEQMFDALDIEEENYYASLPNEDAFFVHWHIQAEKKPGERHPSAQYMFDRGFTWHTLEDWGIGYDNLSQRIAIPIHQHDGTLVGFNGRSWRDNHRPKYLMLGDKPGAKEKYGFATFPKSLVVFGLDRVEKEHLVICEGELNVMMLAQCFIDRKWDPVALSGSNVSSEQINLILRYAKSVTLFMDSDKPGEKATRTLTELLVPYIPVFIVPPHDGDACDLGESSISLLELSTSAIDYFDDRVT